MSAPARHALAGLLATLVLAVLFRNTSLDLDLQALAFRPVEPHWPYAQRQPWLILHAAGTWPGILLSLLAVIVAAGSFLDRRLLRWRFPALFLLLLLALGPGLVTNIFGKILAGRPRPDEVIPFGGTIEFLHPFALGTPGGGFSFLCGHCSMGFLFFGLFYLTHRRSRWAILLGAAMYGSLMGVARVVQAAHFPSDVLLNGTIMFTLAALLSPVAGIAPRPVLTRRRGLVISFSALLVAILIVLFLFSTPIHKERTHTWMHEPLRRAGTHEEVYRWQAPRRIEVHVDRGEVEVHWTEQREPLVIRSRVTGYGWPGADGEARVEQLDRTLRYEHRLERGHWEIHAAFDVLVARGIRREQIFIHSGQGAISWHRQRD